MHRAIVIMILAVFIFNPLYSEILTMSSDGIFTSAASLDEAIQRNCIKVVVTSELTSGESDIYREWPTDITLEIMEGGSIKNTTNFNISSYFIAGNYKVFKGANISFSNGQDSINPEWWGITGVDDQIAINNAIASLPVNGGKVALLPKRYNITGTIVMNKPGVELSGIGAIINTVSNIDSSIKIENEFNILKDVQITKEHCVSVNYAIYITGNNHQLESISSMNQKYPIFIKTVGLRDSHITRVRINGDTDYKSGIIISSDYSVNNTITDCSLQYATYGIEFTGVSHPSHLYKSEGWMITGTSLMCLKGGIVGDCITSLSVVACMLDLNEEWGIRLTNGHTATIANNWFGVANSTSFIGIYATNGTFSQIIATGNTFVGDGAIKSAAIEYNCTNSIFSGNTLENIAGGRYFNHTNTVFGNNYDSSSPLVVSADGGSTTTLIEGRLLAENIQVSKGLIVEGLDIRGGLTGVATTTFGGATLPDKAAGFITIKIYGEYYKIPYYKP